MENILTSEDKKYLRRVSNYLNSMGMKYANIDFEVDGGYIDLEGINWDRVTHFDNNYRADVPDGLIPIMEKIFKYINQNNLYDSPDIESINYERLETHFDTDSKEISVKHYYSYYDEGDTEGLHWSVEEDEDDESIKVVFSSLDELEAENSQLTLRYNGGGDSGYMESYFDEGANVPAAVEDWCYDQLENNFGGWEINEGSSGYFIFDLNDKSVDMSHTNNIEEDVSNTLFEESFEE